MVEPRSGRRLTFVLLLVQASNAALASVVQGVFVGVQPLAIGGVVGLVGLAWGVQRGWRAMRWALLVAEGLMLLGTLPRLLQALQAHAWPDGIWLLANLGLPLAVLLSPRVPPAWADRVTAALLLVTAGVHLALVQEHWQFERALGASFAVDAVLLAGAALSVQRGRRWRVAAGCLLAANLAAYLVAVGPGREAVDSLGLSTKLVELVALGLLLAPRAALGVVAATLLTGAVTWVSLAREGKVGQHTHLAAAAAPPTYQERLAAADLVEATRAGIAAYADVSVARAAGYRATTPLNVAAVHFMNKAYEQDADVLDPRRPEGLVYTSTPDGLVLVGALFELPRLGMEGPTPGGAITHWHTHDNVCIALPVMALMGLATPLGACPPGSVNVTTPGMLHIWTIDQPGGPFADQLDPAAAARLTSRS